ncbi:MAG TPA: hypothetical protein QF764_04080 [Planctomycetota bacterium]|jgi:translation initiation factor 2B subunit (eIF-2B alpha/beta/delta family)|nr:hypothetical protein [Planctomycetota bacterium]
MSSTHLSFHHPEPLGGAGTDLAEALREALSAGAEDRASTAQALAAEAAECLRDWMRAIGESVSAPQLGAHFVAGLATWRAVHGWRAPCERLCVALDELLASCSPDEMRAALDAELNAWTTPGERMPSRRAVCAGAVALLGQGETVLAHGFSETVADACEAAQAAGRAVEVTLAEGAPDLGGQRMASRLAAAGLAVRLVHDAALLACVRDADRVWLGAETVGAGCFVARVGARALLEEARRQEVPSAVLATSDKLAPEGEARLPDWCEGEPWLLWHDAPEGVVVERQLYERVPLGLVDDWLTEVGLERPADIFVRGLRSDPPERAVTPAASWISTRP